MTGTASALFVAIIIIKEKGYLYSDTSKQYTMWHWYQKYSKSVVTTSKCFDYSQEYCIKGITIDLYKYLWNSLVVAEYEQDARNLKRMFENKWIQLSNIKIVLY